MSVSRTNRFSCIALLCLGTFASVAATAHAYPGQSVGRWRMPTTWPQWWGYGVSGGYHAPMVHYPLYQPPAVPRNVYGGAPCIP
ncbi:MAG: hypothetical protein KDA61_11765, partial [Planctomycetales bacterium]|nr:hypothetical protein [Planctomycetales bacterium]